MNEATMFTPKTKVGRCASCDAVMDGYTGDIEITTGSAEYALMNGTWVYTELKDKVAAKKVFIDVKEAKNTSDGIDSTVYIVVSNFVEGKGWVTEEAKGPGTTSYDKTTGVRSLQVNFDSSAYTISEAEGNYTLKKSGSNVLKKDEKTLDFKTGHNHLYETRTGSTTEQAKSVYADPYFKKMTFLGQNLMDKTNHYVECSECGIKNYPVAHKTSKYEDMGGEKTCTCGYTQNTDSKKGAVYFNVYVCSAESQLLLADYYTAMNLYNGIANLTTEEISNTVRSAQTGVSLEDAKRAYEIGMLSGANATTSDFAYLKGMADALKSAVDCATEVEGTGTAMTAMKEADANYSGPTGSTLKTAWGALEAKVDGDKHFDLESNDREIAGLVTAVVKAIISDARALGNTALAEIAEDSLKNLKNVAVDNFAVKSGTLMSLDYSKYTTSKGCTLAFEEGTGWTSLGGVAAVSGGYKVGSEGFLFFTEKDE